MVESNNLKKKENYGEKNLGGKQGCLFPYGGVRGKNYTTCTLH